METTVFAHLRSVFASLRVNLSWYLKAIQPTSFSASVVPAMLGCVLAQKLNPNLELNLLTQLLTLFTVAFVHGACNVMNTPYISLMDHEADDRKTDDRDNDDAMLVAVALVGYEVKKLCLILYILGFISFCWLASMSPASANHLTIFVICLNAVYGNANASFFQYLGIGDVVYLAHGPFSLVFAYLSQTDQHDLEPFYYAIPFALNTEAILLSHNIINSISNKNAGIFTLETLLGLTPSVILYGILIFIPYTLSYLLAIKYSVFFSLPMISIPYAQKIRMQLRNGDNIESIPKKTAILNYFFGILYVIAVIAVDESTLPISLN